MEGDTGKAVQDMMALLSGQNVPTEAVASAGGNTASAENAEGRGPAPAAKRKPGFPRRSVPAPRRYTRPIPFCLKCCL